ncbi:2-polyprenyl-6-methoxyphenol hydroxylase-like FAD-dependent oxidoreductase [Salsuginibacillus halophilus]|uniref:2-polyprenyl-6-methoxyphenol hydroxylase-like FAD-dependent oxidoreductase n=1 Tax=Salsuginibacillus halophilus TaxID=517424 RepID=A0A2P8HY28_9BACI|nr:NAD(P)/FAD-dependent oxidoreductase [Salsuginibacillus halophilus]PSL51129.1 2-polyprenyl-6-methoxyphenol hydroxylase-like FAD-dependent oxidoreductase [Salsuginibacillus halophilus]
MNYHVLIVGGGVAGLTLALKLVRCDVDVLLVEKEPSESPLYKGELVQPKSLEILDKVDILQDMYEWSYPLADTVSKEVDTFFDQQPVERMETRLSYKQLAKTPYNEARMIRHEKLRELLFAKLSTYETFHHMRPAKFTGFTNENDPLKRRAVIETKDGTVEHVFADIYVGAEGRASNVRKSMNVDIRETKYNHQFLTVSFPKPPSLTEAVMYASQSSFLGLFPLPDGEVRTVLLVEQGEWKAMKREGPEAFARAVKQFMPEMEGYVDQIPSWKAIQLMIPIRFNVSHYVEDNKVIIGDTAHSVHPMAGEGMNLAIQDADVLGELIGWMHKRGDMDLTHLKWFEHVRKPRAEYLSKLSHQSALVYAFYHPLWRKLRMRALYHMENNARLHFKQMLNVSGLGLWKSNIFDYMMHMGLPPGLARGRKLPARRQQKHIFTEADDYPWQAGGDRSKREGI